MSLSTIEVIHINYVDYPVLTFSFVDKPSCIEYRSDGCKENNYDYKEDKAVHDSESCCDAVHLILPTWGYDD